MKKSIKTAIIEFDETKDNEEDICIIMINAVIERNKRIGTDTTVEFGPFEVKNESRPTKEINKTS